MSNEPRFFELTQCIVGEDRASSPVVYLAVETIASVGVDHTRPESDHLVVTDVRLKSGHRFVVWETPREVLKRMHNAGSLEDFLLEYDTENDTNLAQQFSS
jgi:hypothetical protein